MKFCFLCPCYCYCSCNLECVLHLPNFLLPSQLELSFSVSWLGEMDRNGFSHIATMVTLPGVQVTVLVYRCTSYWERPPRRPGLVVYNMKYNQLLLHLWHGLT